MRETSTVYSSSRYQTGLPAMTAIPLTRDKTAGRGASVLRLLALPRRP